MSTLAAPDDWPPIGRFGRDHCRMRRCCRESIQRLKMLVDELTRQDIIRTQASGRGVRDSDAAGPGHLESRRRSGDNVVVYVSGNLSMKSTTVVTASMGVIKVMTAKNCGKKPIRMQLMRIGTSRACYRL
jgi:hypothetical protein